MARAASLVNPASSRAIGRACRRAWLAGIVVAAQVATGAAAGTIALRERTDVDGDRVRLGDLVDLAGATEPSADLVMWPSPPPCQGVRVSRAAVSERLRELHAVRSEAIDLSGAEQVAIERRCQRVEPALLAGAGRATLLAWLQPRVVRFDLAPLDPAALELPLGRVSLVARELLGNQAVSARMQVWIDVFVEGRHVRAVPVAFSVHAYRDAWIATRDLNADQPLGSAPLQRRQIDIAQERAEPLLEVPPGSRLRKPLLAGEALTAAHVEEVPAIVRGASVTLRSRLGSIGIEARAEALQDGRPGQLVWVRVASATGPVRARVVDVGVVEVNDE